MKQKPRMHRIILLSLSLLSFGAATQAQTLKEFFKDNNVPLFYYGIDYTRARLIDDANANENDIKERQYNGINDLIVSEAKKYNVKDALHHSNVDHDLGFVSKRNTSVNSALIKSSSSSDYHRLKEDSINSLVKGFDFGDKKGIGLILVCEAMSKSEKAAAYWVTFVDIANKKVLMTERVEAKTGMGFGFRNYWATTVKSLFEEIEKKKYKEWVAKYGV